MKLEITSLHFCYLIHRKSGKIPHFHSKITVFQNPLVRARGNQSLRPCFSGSPDPNGPQKFCEMLVTVFEASKVLCLAVWADTKQNILIEKSWIPWSAQQYVLSGRKFKHTEPLGN